MEYIYYYLRNKLNYIPMWWAMLITYFGYKYDKTKIPPGFYCYAPDETKDPIETLVDEGVYYIKPCPYYIKIGRKNGCKYLAFITDDFVFADQCKSCHENLNINNE